MALALLLCIANPAHAQTATGAGPAAGPLTLSQAVAEALAVNPSARAAVQQLVQAEAKVAQARAQGRLQISFNSTVSGSSADVYQQPPSHETFGTLQNTLTVPLPLGPGPRLAVRQADERLRAAQAQYTGARLALAGQVSTTYYDLLRKQALQAVALETLDQAQRDLGDAQKRNRAGDVAQIDVLQAQVPVANAQAQLYGAQNDVALAQETLNDLLGRSLDAPVVVADVSSSAAAPFPYTLDQIRALALQRSPDVIAADATIRANEAAVRAAGLYRQPTLSLQAIDIRSKDVTSFSRLDTLQAAVTVPLADGGLGKAQVREAEAALAQARAQAASTRKAALVAVSGAYLTAQSSRSQVAAALAARDVAQTTYEKTILGYRNGLFPLVNVLNSQNALAQARISYAQAVYSTAIAANTLNAAVNGGALTGTTAAPGNSPVGTAGPAAGPPAPATNAPGAAGGTSPAGAGTPNTAPSGTSTTGTSGAPAAGRGAP